MINGVVDAFLECKILKQHLPKECWKDRKRQT